MRHERSISNALLLCTCVSFGLIAGGCASRMFNRGGPGTTSAPPTGDPTMPQAKPQKPDKHHGDKSGFTSASDPLTEAHERALENPAEPWWPTRAAQLEAQAGHTAAAENSLRTALSRDSVYAPALTQLSHLLYQQGRYDEAVRLLEPVRDHPNSLSAADRTAVLAGLALHQAALGHDDDARNTLGMLGHADHDDAAGVAAYLAVRGTSAETAMKLTEEAVKAAPESAANHNNRGIALLRSADPDAAAKEFERAIALDPALPGPWYNMAILERWYRLDHVAAAKRFQEYWTRSHADPDSLYAELGRGAPTPPVAEEGEKK